MNIAIDIGNTFTKVGWFNNGGNLEKVESYPSASFNLKSLEADSSSNFIVSSVRNLDQYDFRNIRDIHFLSPKSTLPFQNNYLTPNTLGLDRIAAVAGAVSLYPYKNNFVIDIGTCITYDYVSAERNYLGGIISPGIDIRIKGMHNFTAKLPLVSWNNKTVPTLEGNSTESALLSGAINGVFAELMGMIDLYKKKYGTMNVLITGGGANIFENKFNQPIFALPNLVLCGLNAILIQNVEK